MRELIDKTTVVAEIEGYISNYKDIVAKTDRNDSTWVNSVSMIDAKIGVLQHLLSFLNTLEVKEVDINKEISQFIDANFEKTCKNDTLLDLLNKMPSCITVDGIDYHFVLKKTSYYLAYYNGYKEEYSGNAIFGMTAFSPIELLTAMLEKLKKEGL